MDTKKKIPGANTTPKPVATATGIVRPTPRVMNVSYGHDHGDVLSPSCLKSVRKQLSKSNRGYISNAHVFSTASLDIDIENFSIAPIPKPEPVLTDCLYDDVPDDMLTSWDYYMKYGTLRRGKE